MFRGKIICGNSTQMMEKKIVKTFPKVSGENFKYNVVQREFVLKE